jgi:hypothetical protein
MRKIKGFKMRVLVRRLVSAETATSGELRQRRRRRDA